jgi:hypothetical protein
MIYFEAEQQTSRELFFLLAKNFFVPLVEVADALRVTKSKLQAFIKDV